jgi:hypothetical protein
VSACDLGLDVRHFGLIFEKRKRMTTNPATRPFWVVAGSGLDVKEKFGKSVFIQFNKALILSSTLCMF